MNTPNPSSTKPSKKKKLHSPETLHHLLQSNPFHFKLDFSYNSYIDAIQNAKTTTPATLKRTFNDYINSVESHYITKNESPLCKNLSSISDQWDGHKKIDLHPTHSIDTLKRLGVENYILYKVLCVHWRGEKVKKRDLELLTPCRMLLFQSLLKRKHGKEAVYELSNKINKGP